MCHCHKENELTLEDLKPGLLVDEYENGCDEFERYTLFSADSHYSKDTSDWAMGDHESHYVTWKVLDLNGRLVDKEFEFCLCPDEEHLRSCRCPYGDGKILFETRKRLS